MSFNSLILLIFCYLSVQIPASRIVAAIFLELAFTAEIRVMLSRQTAPGKRPANTNVYALSMLQANSNFR